MAVLNSSAIVLKKSLFEEVGGYNINMKVWEDYHFFFRIYKKDNIIRIKKNLIVINLADTENRIARLPRYIDIYFYLEELLALQEKINNNSFDKYCRKKYVQIYSYALSNSKRIEDVSNFHLYNNIFKKLKKSNKSYTLNINFIIVKLKIILKRYIKN